MSVLVNGTQLKADRKAAGYTQVAFSATCGSVPLVTVRRAEQGNRIIRVSLQRMADVLEQPVERYIVSELIDKKIEYVLGVEGTWAGFYIEADHGTHPYLVEEAVTLKQDGGRVTGSVVANTHNESRRERYDFARVLNNVMLGTLVTEEWEPPLGVSVFLVSASRNNDWLEGFTSWFDADSDRVETSRCILVRTECANFDRYLEDARASMTQEIALFQLRKLLEAGYGLDQAFTMLSFATRAK